MVTPDEYRAFAAECLQKAEQVVSESVRLELLWLAQLWTNLAEVAERYLDVPSPK